MLGDLAPEYTASAPDEGSAPAPRNTARAACGRAVREGRRKAFLPPAAVDWTEAVRTRGLCHPRHHKREGEMRLPLADVFRKGSCAAGHPPGPDRLQRGIYRNAVSESRAGIVDSLEDFGLEERRKVGMGLQILPDDTSSLRRLLAAQDRLAPRCREEDISCPLYLAEVL